MGLSLSRIYQSLGSLAFWGKDKEVRILMVGLDSAGKTTILYRLQVGLGPLQTCGRADVDRLGRLARSCRRFQVRGIEPLITEHGTTDAMDSLAIGFNVETVSYKNINFQVWDLGGQSSIRPYWRCYYANTQVCDSFLFS